MILNTLDQFIVDHIFLLLQETIPAAELWSVVHRAQSIVQSTMKQTILNNMLEYSTPHLLGFNAFLQTTSTKTNTINKLLQYLSCIIFTH